jgi:hypothetical protein
MLEAKALLRDTSTGIAGGFRNQQNCDKNNSRLLFLSQFSMPVLGVHAPFSLGFRGVFL